MQKMEGISLSGNTAEVGTIKKMGTWKFGPGGLAPCLPTVEAEFNWK